MSIQNSKAGWLFEPETMTLTVTGGWFKEPHVIRCTRETALLTGTYEAKNGKRIPIRQQGIVRGGKDILLINKKDDSFFGEKNGTWPMFLGRFVGSATWEVDAGFSQYVRVKVDYANGWREPIVTTKGL